MGNLQDNYRDLEWELNKTKEIKDKFKQRAKELKLIVENVQVKKLEYLTEYQIEQMNKETKAELIDRLNEAEKRYRRLNWELDHYGKATILISKSGAILQTLNFNEDTNPHGLRIDDLKETAQSLEKLYQDYESNIESTIILKSEWDERQ